LNGRSIPCWLRCPPTLENIGEQSRGADANDGGVHEARTVKGGRFKFAGNLGAGIEIFFPNSPRPKISADNTKRIRKEIDEHKALQ
jgi:hypothetical protein